MIEMAEQKCLPKEDTRVAKELVYTPYEKQREAWVAMVQNMMQANTNDELTSILQRMCEAKEIPIKWNKINRPKFLNFLRHLMDYQGNPTKDEQLWNLVSKDQKEKKKSKTKDVKNNLKTESRVAEKDEELAIQGLAAALPAKKKAEKSQNSKEENKKVWAVAIQNLIQTNTNEELMNSLRRISTASNILHVKKWQEIKKNKFSNFLNNIPGYQVDSVIDEKLRVLISKAMEDQHIKQKNEKKIFKGITPKPFQKEKNAEWLSFVTNLIDKHNQKLVSDAGEKITARENIPKTWNGIKKTDFKNFLQNNLGYEVNSAIAENLWDLIAKALQEKRVIKAKNGVIQKTTEKTKGKKRKSDIDNIKPAINGGSAKRIKKTVELKTPKNESCNPLSDIITVSQTEEPCCKVKWISIGKMLLRAADNKELPLKKFRKKIIAEYLNRAGTAVSDKSSCSETLWSKCQSKLAKNPKFQIDPKRIRLVV
ncbi:uncharacterized protein LOC116933816 [Daphnia magna]|uniref:uncharacterized protein LOC116933816 n=1 Tax=Daphnia magna TaxID=35525 RepID=UPI0006DF8C3A|nr:uncharacterized protein LOC116933816 [Daphnia magna]XP_045035698.1 uncharacterized protein LOC116933816 [Daphnia magna]XP_045035707.1 uncharacterized protein LOC116933816 [Daphnia magna]XP_045035716.1 uncharacterized protein LOC116933816 [Daphnia magna]XP_045035719.1 uncharacterized protein LOC116933816 [Daphnia magna]XP_045035724.1 uncharacterized protein LOC116933816 [Daphnia magna]XP_045035725.1 uncharacterized protein LOC116933816 [Daphnia magna]XP_045035730.1 uncharacterized protein 